VPRHFQGGAVELGWLESGFGVGIITGGVLLSVWGGFKRKVITSMSGLIGMGAGILIVGLADKDGYWAAMAGMAMMGFMNPLVNGPLFALLQSKVDPEMQGRVFTLIVSGSAAISPLGMIVASPVAEWLGIQAWYVVGGLVCAAMGVAGFLIKSVITIDEQEPGGKLNAAVNVQTAPVASD